MNGYFQVDALTRHGWTFQTRHDSIAAALAHVRRLAGRVTLRIVEPISGSTRPAAVDAVARALANVMMASDAAERAGRFVYGDVAQGGEWDTLTALVVGRPDGLRRLAYPDVTSGRMEAALCDALLAHATVRGELGDEWETLADRGVPRDVLARRMPLSEVAA